MAAVESIGRYPTVRVLGEGAMGTVYLARDPIIGRLVAIKVVRTGAGGPVSKARLLQEARAAGRLTHPNIVSIFHADEEDGQPYFVMEYVEGQTLASIIQDGPALPASRKLLILERICSALACAHEAGLVHRDIKPTNIILNTTYEPKILDFGLAKLHDAQMTLTQEHAILGTLSYMAPEQLAGGAVDHRSDLFATAVVAYEFLTGRRAFTRNAKEIVERILHPSSDAGIDAEGLEPPLARLLTRGLDPRPEHRFQSAREFGQALRAARQGLDTDLSDGPMVDNSLVVPLTVQTVPTPEVSRSGVQTPPMRVPRRATPTPPSIGKAAAVAMGLTGVVTLGLFIASGPNGRSGDAARTRSVDNAGAAATSSAAVPARILPAGTDLPVAVLTRLDSRGSAKGDRFTGALSEAVVRNGYLVVPAGTHVEGQVDRVGVTEDGQPFMGLILTGLAHRGTLIPLSASSNDVVAPSLASEATPRVLVVGGETAPGVVHDNTGGDAEHHHTQLIFRVSRTVDLK